MVHNNKKRIHFMIHFFYFYSYPSSMIGRLHVRFPMVSMEFSVTILPAALWPWGQLSL